MCKPAVGFVVEATGSAAAEEEYTRSAELEEERPGLVVAAGIAPAVEAAAGGPQAEAVESGSVAAPVSESPAGGSWP